MSHGVEGAGYVPRAQQRIDAFPEALPEGEYRGRQVTQSSRSESSLIQDALEELPANMSEKFSKRLAERTAKSRAANRIQKLLEKYSKFIPGMEGTEKFQQLAGRLKSLGNPNTEQIKQQLQEHLGGFEGESIGGAESGILLALEELFVEEGQSDALLSAVREVKAELGADLRDFYERQVRTYEGVNEAYESLLGNYGEQDFVAGTEVMIKRLGNELHSQGRGLDTNQLKATLDTLYHLEVARNTYLAFTELVEKMQTMVSKSP